MNDADKPLTPKEEQFCHEYQVDLNGAAAARRAGYSEKSARVIASRLLSKVNIQRRLAELGGARQDKADVDAEEVARMLAETYKDAREAGQYGPATRCAELLGKRFAMFVDKVVGDEDRKDPKAAFDEMTAGNPEARAVLGPLIFGVDWKEDGQPVKTTH